MNKSDGILGGLVVGWEDIEPILMACISANLNAILRGKHGASKTIFAKLVAQGLGGVYRHYDATKDDMISVAGIPNPEALKNGELSFSKHQRTIWDADYISIDELTRAPRESQNLWLEILEEKTCSGFPLKYQMALATMNPSTYNATYRLDEALLDRFTAVIEIPNVVNKPDCGQNVYDIVKLNINGKRVKRDNDAIVRLGEAILKIKSYYHELMQSTEVVESVCTYMKIFGEELERVMREQKNFYISPRRYIHFANCLIACAAYYKLAQSSGSFVTTDGIFVAGAKTAARYVVSSPLNIDTMIIKTCHEKAVNLLKNLAGNESDKLLVKMNDTKKLSKKVKIIDKNIDLINSWQPSEIGSIFNSIYSNIKQEINNFQNAIENSSNLQSKQIKNCIELGKGIDLFEKICNKILLEKDKYSTALAISAKNAIGALYSNKFTLMFLLAQENKNKNKNIQTELYTFARIKQTVENEDQDKNIWDGHFKQDSLEKTILKILEDKINA